MKKIAACLIVLVAMGTQGLFAQDATGTWQGSIQPGPTIRLVIKISSGEGGRLNGVLYSIDQGPQPIATTVLLQGDAVKLTMPGIGGGYDGRLSADGKTISGTFTQGGRGLPLNLVRTTPETAWAIPQPPASTAPMAANANPAFEVATIKPSDPNRPGKLFTVRGRQVLTVNTTVSDMLAVAYGIHPRQIVGGPDWLATQKYDVTGEPDTPGQPSTAQLRVMLQKLLGDRFKLSFHRDTKELPVYALVVGPKGPLLTRSAGDPNGLPGLLFQGLGVLPARNATMGDFAGVMQTAVLDRPVVDKTGLSGRYDFTLKWTPDETQFASMGVRVPPPTDDPNAPPGLFTAIQEQLGLKFDSTKAPVDVLVIDRVERPSEN